MTPEDLLRITENQRKLSNDITAKLDYITTIIQRLQAIEKWDAYPNWGHAIKYLTIQNPIDNRVDHDMRQYMNIARVARKIFPIIKEELLLLLQEENKKIAEMKEKLTGVKEEKS